MKLTYRLSIVIVLFLSLPKTVIGQGPFDIHGIILLNQPEQVREKPIEKIVEQSWMVGESGIRSNSKTVTSIIFNQHNQRTSTYRQHWRQDTLRSTWDIKFIRNKNTTLVDSILFNIDPYGLTNKSNFCTISLLYDANNLVTEVEYYNALYSINTKHFYELNPQPQTLSITHIRDRGLRGHPLDTVEYATYNGSNEELTVTTHPQKNYARRDTFFIWNKTFLQKPIRNKWAFNVFGDLICERHKDGKSYTYYHYEYDEHQNWIKKERWSYNIWLEPTLWEVQERTITYRE